MNFALLILANQPTKNKKEKKNGIKINCFFTMPMGYFTLSKKKPLVPSAKTFY
jgi:hypothetical protein